MASKLPRVVLGLASAHNFVFGAVYLVTAGVKGFQGLGGEDTLLLKLLGYSSVAMILAGLASLYVAIKPSKRGIAAAGAIVLLTGVPLILFSLLINGAINLALGLIAVLASRKIRA